jgi:hypothetical protein
MSANEALSFAQNLCGSAKPCSSNPKAGGQRPYEIDIYFQVLLRLLLVIVLGGCTAMPPPVTAVDAERAHVMLADLQQGRDLLVGKCGGCHAVPLPADLERAKWPSKVDEMSARAGLVPSQRELIAQYLVTMDPK